MNCGRQRRSGYRGWHHPPRSIDRDKRGPRTASNSPPFASGASAPDAKTVALCDDRCKCPQTCQTRARRSGHDRFQQMQVSRPTQPLPVEALKRGAGEFESPNPAAASPPGSCQRCSGHPGRASPSDHAGAVAAGREHLHSGLSSGHERSPAVSHGHSDKAAEQGAGR
jgi:hypothetical protein